jgi:hypothetical protein
LHLQLNGSAVVTNIVATTLAASGANTITIDSVANVTGVTTFPIISYASGSPVNGNFMKGTLPNGFSANVVNNTAQKRIDLVIAPNAVVTPRMNTLNLLGTNLVVAGTNGFPNGFYSVLSSTNVALPINKWQSVLTNQFDAGGGFQFANPLDPNAAQVFYLLQLQ